MTEMLVAFARPVRHEANNLLAALSGTAEIMLRSATSTERDLARAERLRDASLRLQALLQAYLALGAPPPAGTPPAAVLDTMCPLIRLALGPGRNAGVEAAADLPMLQASPAALQDVILRLARDAAAIAPPDADLLVTLEPAAGGALLSAHPSTGGAAPPPVFLPAARASLPGEDEAQRGATATPARPNPSGTA